MKTIYDEVIEFLEWSARDGRNTNTETAANLAAKLRGAPTLNQHFRETYKAIINSSEAIVQKCGGHPVLARDILVAEHMLSILPGKEEEPLHPVGVSVLVTDRQGTQTFVLVGRRITNDGSNGLWSTPGGRLEVDELIHDCARRELLEETGLTAQATEVIGWAQHSRFGKPHPYIMFYVRVRGWTGSLENREPSKCQQWSWLNLNMLVPWEQDPSHMHTCTEPEHILHKLRQP